MDIEDCNEIENNIITYQTEDLDFQFYKCIYLFQHDMMRANNFIEKMNELSNKGMNYLDIQDIKKIIQLINNKNKKAGKIMLLIYCKNHVYNEIHKYIKNSKTKQGKYISFKPYEIISQLIEFRTLIKNDYNYVNSFGTISKLDDNNKYNEISRKFLENEIMQRFELLFRRFKPSFLKSLGCRIIKHSEFKESNEDIIFFYNRSIKLIRDGIEKILILCDMYVSLEKTYINAIVSKKYTVKNDKFTIVIESE